MKQTTKIIPLIYPIKVPTANGKEIDCYEITLGRLQGRHIRDLDDDFFTRAEEGKMKPSEIIDLIGKLANLSPESADQIDVIEDLPNITKELQPFLAPSPVADENSSGA